MLREQQLKMQFQTFQTNSMTANEKKILTALLTRIKTLEAENRQHHKTFAVLVESEGMTTARIAAIERFVREMAIKSYGDTPETAEFCQLIEKYFHQKFAQIKKFKAPPPSSLASN